MKAENIKPFEPTECRTETDIKKEEKILLLVDNKKKTKSDDTIVTPDKYVSRYHYNTKNIDAVLELCPHCKKPTLSAFKNVVIDSAVAYLTDKEEQKVRKSSRRRTIALVVGALTVMSFLYYWLFYIVSGLRI